MTKKVNRPNRGGKVATSKGAPSPPALPLGDIKNLRTFVGKVASGITQNENETEDLIAEGIVLACRREKDLAPRESLQRALSGWLEARLRDYWRAQHPEIRRNTRGATTYTLPTPTGLAWEQNDTTAGMPLTDEHSLVDSRLDLRFITSAEDLRNPKVIGRIAGVPSYAGLPTGRSEELWATIEEERALTTPPKFNFIRGDDL